MGRNRGSYHSFRKCYGNYRHYNGDLNVFQRTESGDPDSWLPAYRRVVDTRHTTLAKIFDPKRVDRVIDVSQADATAMTRKLASSEGIFAGMSSGGAAYAAIKLARELDRGIIVFIVCDRGDRYLSSDLFA